MRVPDSILRSVVALVEILRPGNVVIMMLGVVVGFIIETGFSNIEAPEHTLPLALAALSVALIGAGANVQNDVADIHVDRLNRPSRVLPSGRLSAKFADRLGLVLSVAGLAAALSVSVLHAAIALACIALLVAYNRGLKHRGLFGNLVVGLVTAVTLLFGALVSGSINNAWLGFVFALLLTVAREITKDIEDIPGDTTVDSGTLPIGIGVDRSALLVKSLVTLTILLLPLPYMIGYGGLYFLAIIPVGLLLLESLRRKITTDAAGTVSHMLKYTMFVGLVSLVLGRVGY